MLLTPEIAMTIVRVAQTLLYYVSTLDLTSELFPKEADLKGVVCDFIVVGGGTAGCVAAARLSEMKNYTVCLLEAGGNPPLEAVVPALFPFTEDSYSDWRFRSQNDNYTAQAHKGNVFNLIQGKMLSGTGGNNFMISVRGNKNDYDHWAELSGDDTWNYENVLPYLKGLERITDEEIMASPYMKYHGTEGNIGIQRFPHDSFVEGYLQGFEKAGHPTILDINSNETLGYTQSQFALTDGFRQSTAYGYLNPIKNRKNLYVKRNTFVTKIIIKNNKAVGVKAQTKDGKTFTLKASKEVIVSAGAFNTPKLLMLSGIGPKDHLKEMDIEVVADLPVGRLLARPDVEIDWKTRKSVAPKIPFLPTEFPLPVLVGMSTLNKSLTYPEYQALVFATQQASLVWLIACPLVFTFDYDLCKELYDAGATHDMFYTIVSNLHPKSTGKVLLKSKDPNDDPIIWTGYFSEDEDLEKTVDIVLDYIDGLNHGYYKEMGAEMVYPTLKECDCLDRESREYWRCFSLKMMVTEYQYCGTAAMGMVVDCHLRVMGVKNLRVIDSSVIPRHTSGTLYIPIIMAAEKACDFIKEDYGYKKTYAKNQCVDEDVEETDSGAPKGDLVTGLFRSNNALSLGKIVNKVNKVKDTLSDSLIMTFEDSLNTVTSVAGKTVDTSGLLKLPKLTSNFTEMSQVCFDSIMSLFNQG